MSLFDKARMLAGRALLKLVDDSRKCQELQLQLLSDEVRSNAERFQDYGFTSHPLPGAEAIALFIGGDRSHPVVIAVEDRRYRKKDLAEGEVAMYTDEGDYVLFKRGRIIEIKAGTEVKVDAPLATFTGNVQVNGNITCSGNVSDASGSMQEMRGVYNTHKHTGVTTGGGTSGNPNASMT